MVVKLTQKEQMLLQDLKSHEEWCIKKYTEAQNRASDPALKQTFGELLGQERQHLDTVNQILSGTVPPVNQASSAGQTGVTGLWGKKNPEPTPAETQKSVQADIDLCQDLLNNEKYVSGVYDTVILNAGKGNPECFKSHSKRRTGTRGKTVSIHETARRLQRPITRKKKLIWEA